MSPNIKIAIAEPSAIIRCGLVTFTETTARTSHPAHRNSDR